MKDKTSAGQSILKGLREALAYERGEETKARVHTIDPSEVVCIRKKTGLTQVEFSKTFAIPLSTLRKWEQGDRTPHGPAGVLLRIIEKNPKVVLDVLH